MLVAGSWLLAAAVFGLVQFGMITFGGGPARWIELAYGITSAVLLVLLQIGVGAFVLKRFAASLPPLSPAAQALFSFATGTYVSSFVLMLLAIASALSAWTAFAYLLVAAALSALALWDRRELRSPPPRVLGGADWLLMIVVFFWSIPFVIQALLPNSDWDGALFHLPFAERILEVGVLGIDPTFEAYNYPAAAHLFYAVLTAIGADSGIQLFNLLASLGVLVALYTLGTHFWDPSLARLAVIVGLSLNVLWEVAITPRIDTLLALYSALAAWAFVAWRRQPEHAGMLAMCGMMLGMALAVKYTGAVVAVVLVPAILVTAAWDRVAWSRKVARPVITAALLCAAVSSFWYTRNTLVLGDPMYPMLRWRWLYETRDGTYVPVVPEFVRLYASRPPDDVLRRTLAASPFAFALADVPPREQQSGTLYNLWDAVKRPELYARKPLHTAGPFVLLFFALPLVAGRDRTSWWLFAIGLALYLLIASRGSMIRFLAPALPLMAWGAARLAHAVDDALWSRQGISGRWLSWLLVALVVPIAGLLYRAEWTKLRRQMHPVEFFTGALEQDEWVAMVGYNGNRPLPQFVLELNRAIDAGRFPSDAHLLMVGEGCGHLLKCSYQPDMSWHAHTWIVEMVRGQADPAQIAANLRERRVDYILVNVEFLKLCYEARQQPLVRDWFRLALYELQRLILEEGRIVHIDDRGIMLIRLTGPDGESATAPRAEPNE